MYNIKQIKTEISNYTPLTLCRIHLSNFKTYQEGKYSSYNVSYLLNKRVIRDELELILSNLVNTYGIETTTLAVKNLKMLTYCKKYLKSA